MNLYGGNMSRLIRRSVPAVLVVVVAILACNYPTPSPTPDVGATFVAGTLTALAQVSSAPQSGSTTMDTSTSEATVTSLPSSTPTAGNPVVIHDALCSAGPGSAYEVVSSVKIGTSVELMGVGSIPGWYIIRNPVYHDPCWIAASNLQIDPGYNVSALKIFYPPSTPTSVPSATPVPTT
jgi:hypothetical protein